MVIVELHYREIWINHHNQFDDFQNLRNSYLNGPHFDFGLSTFNIFSLEMLAKFEVSFLMSI